MFRAGARANFQDAEKMEEQVSSGWRTERTRPSLAEVHRTIPIARDAGFWRKLLAFSGPGYLVAVGYMDPGNWATDLAGGAQFWYKLVSIIFLLKFVGGFLQSLCVQLWHLTRRGLP